MGRIVNLGQYIGRPNDKRVYNDPSNSVAVEQVFLSPFTANTTPTTGQPATFTRGNSMAYFNGLTTGSSVSSDVAAIPNFPFNGAGTSGGVGIYGMRKNIIVQDRNFTTTWAVVGTGSAVSNTWTDPFGSAVGDTINGIAANDGVEINTGVAVGTKTFSAAVLMRAASGTVNVTLRIKGSGVADEGTQAYVVDTTPRWYTISRTFSTATGNAIFGITLDAIATSVQVSRAVMADRDEVGFESGINRTLYPIDTSGSAVTVAQNVLTYTDALSFLSRSNWSWCGWVNTQWVVSNMKAAASKTIWSGASAASPGGAFLVETAGSLFIVTYAGPNLTGLAASNATSLTANTWQQFAITCDYQQQSVRFFKNGVSIGTLINPGFYTAPDFKNLRIGSVDSDNQSFLDGIAGQQRFARGVYTDANILAFYNNEKTAYGL